MGCVNSYVSLCYQFLRTAVRAKNELRYLVNLGRHVSVKPFLVSTVFLEQTSEDNSTNAFTLQIPLIHRKSPLDTAQPTGKEKGQPSRVK